MFNADIESENGSLVSEIKENLIYPYLPEFFMQIDIELERGVVLKDVDRTGITAMLGNQSQESFFLIGNQQKNYFPRSDSTVPVELRLRLSK